MNQLKINSPGRINLIGEHMDYNGGLVFPGAIDLGIQFKFEKRTDSLINVSTDLGGSFSLDLSVGIEPSNQEWANYLIGVLVGIQNLGFTLANGFDCHISSTLPLGSGLSSSAALECGFAKGINELCGLGISSLELLTLCQKAEHDFVGTQCGIMDQFAVTYGKKDHLMLLNCDTLEHQYIKASFEPYQIVLLNTNVSHNLASSEYNVRRTDCEIALSIIQKHYVQYSALAEVPMEAIERVKEYLTPSQYANAVYVNQEQQRTLAVSNLLKEGAVEAVGAKLYESHEGLSKLYKVSCDELDFMVAFSKKYEEVIGSRMMGGGFGGCTINIIHRDFIDEYIDLISIAYQKKFTKELTPIKVALSDGVQVL